MSYHQKIQSISSVNLYVSALAVQASQYNTMPLWIGPDQNIDLSSFSSPIFTGLMLSPGDVFKFTSSNQEEIINLKNFCIQYYEDHAKVNILYWQWDGKIYPALQRSDALVYDQLSNTWTMTNGVPSGYSLITQPTMAIDLMPAPSENGFLECIYTEIGQDLSNTGIEMESIPTDFSVYVKWGTIGRMLDVDGPARDVNRAAYCKNRFEEGVEIARALSGDFYA